MALLVSVSAEFVLSHWKWFTFNREIATDDALWSDYLCQQIATGNGFPVPKADTEFDVHAEERRLHESQSLTPRHVRSHRAGTRPADEQGFSIDIDDIKDLLDS